MAREIARRIGDGHVLAIDRSATAIRQAEAASRAEIEAGRLALRQVAVEDFALEPGEAPFDLAVAVRVGALDGRHPRAGEQARRRIAAALAPGGRLFVDGGDPLRELPSELTGRATVTGVPALLPLYGECDDRTDFA